MSIAQHDFLAAKQWVESGEFAQRHTYEWDARTGYAACLIEDATDILKQALAADDGLATVTEIIGNYASFENRAVTDALITYFSADHRVTDYERRSQSEVGSKYAPRVAGQLENGSILRLANSRLLDAIVEYCCDRNSKVSDLLVAYAVTELYERRLRLMHQTYNKAVAAYRTERFTFVVRGAKQAQLDFLNPVPQNRLKGYRAPETED